ncbi:flavoprotein, partial [Aeromicrobium sp.]|uniref:flavoprotein n=1 Tax=Aeromicrobium sp. TaxID=1871063 RepID=UPI003D6A4A61
EAVVVEAGAQAGAAVREWSHVRLFSPWSELVDPAARKLLVERGWTEPDPDSYPTGGDWADSYLQPLADALGTVRYSTRVTGVARDGRDVLVDSGRDREAFAVHLASPEGTTRLLARAVIDASGTWTGPNPLGADGLPALGEPEHADRISYRIPDFRDPAVRARYAGKHIAVAGTGASAQTVLIELNALARNEDRTRVSWLVRRARGGDSFGGGDNDQLVERGALGARAREAVTEATVTTVPRFRTTGVEQQEDGRLTLAAADGQQVTDVDEVIVVTGFRPDLTILSEVRLDLDPVLSSPRVLAPLIDPNVHSCGTVYPHGAKELEQPEHGLFVVGMKSYGRAPSFLALTGFEQVRSVVAEIDGDHEAAARVELTLPETGVCGGAGLFDEAEASGGGCCAAPAGPELVTLGRPADR